MRWISQLSEFGKKYVFFKLILVIFLIFSFFKVRAANYYWVGGAGLWSEVDQHWATSSGGTTFHSIVPTSTDNIYFDANSFDAPGQYVEVDGNFANFASMDWSGVTNTPEFRSTSADLTVFGSFTLNPDMTVDLNSDISFEGSSTGLEITSAGHQLTDGNVSFNNDNGTWELQDSLNVDGNISLINGGLTTNGNPVSSHSFIASDGIYLNMENSTFYNEANYSSSWGAYGTDSQILSNNSIINTYSMNGGVGYDYNIVNLSYYYSTGTTTISGDSLTVNEVNSSHSLNINLTNSAVGDLFVEGDRTTFNRSINTFNSAILESSTVYFRQYSSYSSSQVFESLTFTSSGVSVYLAGDTLKVNSYLGLSSSCEKFVTLQSITEGETVTLEVPFDVTLDYINLRDISVIGGGNYEILNVVDQGGNVGWTLGDIGAHDLYWIGGSSDDWSDGDNWSLTSGGSAYGCPPTIKDNVFFDQNSFSTTDEIVSISTTTAYAKNIDWTGVLFEPQFRGNQTLYVDGSLTMVDEMTSSFNGRTIFSSCETGNVIELNGTRPTSGSIYFECDSGGWTLLDSLSAGGIYLNGGELIADNGYLYTGEIIISDSSLLSLENTTVYLYDDGWEIGKGVDLNSTGTNFTLHSTTTVNSWLPNFLGGTGYDYGTVLVLGNPTQTYSVSCTECMIDSIIGEVAQTNLNLYNSEVDYVYMTAADGTINARETHITDLVINTNEGLYVNASNSSLTVENLTVLNPSIDLIVRDSLIVTSTLNIPSNCNTFFGLKSVTSGTQAYVVFPDNTILEYVALRDIWVGNGSNYQALNSIDEGGNVNWDISALSGQTLYWIGGEGEWNDGTNWSATSGGSPLGCAPSPLDTVIFDENSFDQVGQTVTASAGINIATMDWRNVTNEPVFSTKGDLSINSSLYYSEDMTLEVKSDYLFKSCAKGNEIQTGNNYMTTYDSDLNKNFTISFVCDSGEWILQDSLKSTSYIYLNNGSLVADGNTIKVQSISLSDNVKLDIRNSDVILSSGLNLYYSGIEILADSSSLYLLSSRLYTSSYSYDFWDVYIEGSSGNISGRNLTFNNVYLNGNGSYLSVSNTTANSLIANANVVSISGSGNTFGLVDLNSSVSATISGSQTIDTLSINTGGMELILQSGQTQTVNHELNIVQTPSFPILLSSTTQGTQADLLFLGTKPPCSEFLFLRDNNITGLNGVPFYAGLDSDDIDNNTGWIFESQDDCNSLLCEFEGTTLDLGQDTTFCLNYTLQANPVDVPATYQWMSLSGTPDPKDTLETYVVTVSDTVVLSLATDICTISDTVIVTKDDCSVIFYSICEGDSILLESSQPSSTHIWEDGTTQNSIYASSTGYYWVENDNGLGVLRDSFYVAVNALPDFSLGGDTSLCNGATYSYEAPSGYSDYTWSFGGSGREYTTDTSAFVWLEIEDASCIARDSIHISTNTVTLNGLGNDTTICPGAQLGWNGTLTGLDFLWDNGDAGFEDVARVVKDSGTYWLEVSSGECKLRDSIVVALEDIPTVKFTFEDTSFCNIASAELFVEDKYESYVWSTGETDTLITITQSGNYWVSAQKGNCAVGDTVAITMIGIPPFTLGEDTTLCSTDTLKYNATLTGLDYEWEDGTTGTGVLERAIYEAGTYSLSISTGGCSRSDTIEVFESIIQALDLPEDTTLCEDSSIELGVLNLYDTYLWSDGSTLDSTSIITPGEYQLEATLAHCTVYDTVLVELVNLPVFDLGNDTVLCIAPPYQLSSPATSFAKTWDDNSISSTRDVNVDGTYWLQLDDRGCVYRDSIEVSFQSVVVLDLGNDTVLCDNAVLDLAIQTGYDSYLWNDNSSNSTLQVSAAGDYKVTITEGSCVVSDSIEISYFTTPNFNLGNDTTLCFGDSLLLEKSGTPQTWLWSDASSTNQIVIESAGLYWLEAANDICVFRDSIDVNFYSEIVFDLGNDTTLCDTDTLTLDAPSTYLNYTWSNGSSTPQLEILESALIKIEITENACLFVDSIDVVFNLLPEFDLGEDTLVCVEDSLVLNVATVADSIIWNDLSTAPSLLVEGTANYIATAYRNTCAYTDSIMVEVAANPAFYLAEDTIQCGEDTLFLDVVSTPGDSYQWSNGDVSSASSIVVEGLYAVAVTNVKGCATTKSIEVENIEKPYLVFPELEMCPDESVIISPSYVGQFTWLDGEMAIDREVADFKFYVASAENECGIAQDSVAVNELDCSLYIPEVFSPNGDGIYDSWLFERTEFFSVMSVEVYNRWGNLVYENSNYNNSWMGYGPNGVELPAAVYYYIVKADDKEYHGNVTIVR